MIPRRPQLGRAVAAVSLAVLVLSGTGVAAGGPAEEAGQILEATGIKGGLIVHLGCGDGRLTAALRAGNRYLVHGLDADGENVAKARAFIQSKGAYGPVSVERLDGKALPYADDLVNLVVAEDAGGVGMDEILRVLCPGGVAYVKTNGGWSKTVKPWPKSIDQWTHYLHDATNNAVARDTQVGPPRRTKWVCGPLWSRSHEFTSSLAAMVSAAGRLIYLFDEGLTGVTPASLPERWTLIARDAFNGVLLWRRPIENWRAGQWKNTSLRSAPPSVPRLLVAEGDRVFFPLTLGAPVSILDAATGKVLTTCKDTDGAQELRCLDGVLLVRTRNDGLRAFDAKTGKPLWQGKDNPQPLTLAAHDGKVVYMAGQAMACLDLKTGKQRWRTAGEEATKPPADAQAKASTKRKPIKRPAVSLLLVHGDRILLAGRQGLRAVSLETGKPLWTAKGSLGGRGELFVAQGQAWRWQGHEFVGHDLATGQVKTTVNADDVFTAGHHLRCYQGKATENYIITPWRGVEFVSLTGGEHTQNDWLRGPCRYGIMPCNGLLYAPPHPCFCYPGVKLTGFNVLAPAVKALADGTAGKPADADGQKRAPPERLERGPAFSEISNLTSQISDPKSQTSNPKSENRNPDDWPTYRHDARRTGSTAGDVPADASLQWATNLRGPLTPPVVAAGRVYVAAKDEHTLHALDANDGGAVWQFIAGGRIDSPPTVYRGRVLFGCADGRVYCLRASDGALAWRFRAAPAEQLIGAFGQLESRWRVHGSVLITGGVAYCTAGRSTYLDGGIRVFGLDPKTGKVLHKATLDTWARTREDAVGKPFVPGYHMEGAFSDILVSEDGYLYMGQYKLDAKLARQDAPYVLPAKGEKVEAMDLTGKPFVSADVAKTQPLEVHQRKWLENAARPLVAELRQKHGAFNIGHRRMGLRVFATAGFLDDSWYNRTYWMYSTSWPGYYLAHRGAKTGQLLVVGPEKTYAVQAYPNRNLQSPLFTPGEKGYLLFADSNDNEPVLSDQTRETTKGWGFTRKNPPEWHRWVPVRIRAMVLAGKRLFVAGPPDVVDPDDPMAAFDGRKGAVLHVHSADDGKRLAEHQLEAPPVFDGLIAVGDRLYVSLTNGRVLCMGKTK
jgi:outer membrane protein assembly factor BamB